MSPDDVASIFLPLELNDAEDRYLKGQAKRLAYLTDLVQRYCQADTPPKTVLDIGPHFLTRCLLEAVRPTPIISTLGYSYPKLVPPERISAHANLDINECARAIQPFQPGTFDIITICEVIEHLFIPPDVVLSFLKPLLRQPSGIIIAGTPNAVSLSKRLRMVMGINPFQELSESYRNYQAHIREYTMGELHQYGQKAGLSAIYSEYCNYWEQEIFPGQGDIANLERDVPMFRGGLTVIYGLQTAEF